jgi:hypothetical protein
MSDIDNFRKQLDDDNNDLPQARVIGGNTARRRTPKKILGMTAGERAVVSVMLFLIVLIISVGALVASGRIQLG